MERIKLLRRKEEAKPNFVITHRTVNASGIDLLEVKGLIDTRTSKKIKRKINGFFAEEQYKIIADLSKVDYMTSAGVDVFINCVATARNNGGDIVFLKPSSYVRSLFVFLGISQIFIITTDLDRAIKSFRKK